MLLHYVTSGARNYRKTWGGGRDHAHPFWEFSVAVSGRIAPMIAGWELEPRSRCLWAIPPKVVHGWTGDGAAAEVVVLCPSRVPDALVHAAGVAEREHRLPTCPVDAPLAERLVRAAQGLLARPRRSDPLLGLRQELEVQSLCLRLLEACPERWLRGLTNERRQTVDAACAWFSGHLESSPDEATIAREVHVSPAQLRRLFHAELGCSPRRQFTRLRLAHADSLLLHTDWTLERIATACGLSSAVSLCRLFRRERGASPRRQAR
jgi:AraC-like DNA-binding protein